MAMSTAPASLLEHPFDHGTLDFNGQCGRVVRNIDVDADGIQDTEEMVQELLVIDPGSSDMCAAQTAFSNVIRRYGFSITHPTDYLLLHDVGRDLYHSYAVHVYENHRETDPEQTDLIMLQAAIFFVQHSLSYIMDQYLRRTTLDSSCLSPSDQKLIQTTFSAIFLTQRMEEALRDKQNVVHQVWEERYGE